MASISLTSVLCAVFAERKAYKKGTTLTFVRMLHIRSMGAFFTFVTRCKENGKK